MRFNCGNCIFYRDNGPAQFRDGFGKCHRYPEPKETNDGYLCGEHKPKFEGED